MVKKTNLWNPVQIDGNIFSGGIEGLIGIEECRDYNLDDIVSTKSNKKHTLLHDNQIFRKKKVTNKKKKRSKLLCSNNDSQDTNILSPSKCGNTLNITEEQTDEFEGEEMDNLEAWNSFGLPKTIMRALQELKFYQPTEIQALTLPAAVLGRRDILGAAETGSGKTLAFGLPILAGILKMKEKELSGSNSSHDYIDNLTDSSEESDFEKDSENIADNEVGCIKSINNVKIGIKQSASPLYALILTPTRELAMQIKSHLQAVAKYTGINVAVVVGGLAAVKQERILGKCPEIVVATPGRLWELIQQGNPHLSQIDNIRFFAIDETDRMLEKGHFDELHNLLERVNLDEFKKKQRQNFVFSATLTLVHELPKHLKNKSKFKRKIRDMTPVQKLEKIVDMLGITDPKVVDITQGRGTSGTLTECRITCGIEEKDYYLYYFLKTHPGRTLIFCNSIGCVKRLTTLLTLLNCNPLPLHAAMQQRQRLKNLERFRYIENSTLIATDVAARGLDIPCIEQVLHYQTPRTSESYVHRSGRTARASHNGLTMLLVEPNELQNYLRICRTLGKSDDLPVFPVKEDILEAVKQKVNLARDLDKLQLQVKKANSEAGWFQKAADDMDIIVDDFAKKYNSKEAEKFRKAADIKRKQLTSLLSTPIVPKNFNRKFPLQSAHQPYTAFTEDHREEKALEVLKSAVETISSKKKKCMPLYKSNKKNSIKRINDGGVIKLSKNKNVKKGRKDKKRFS